MGFSRANTYIFGVRYHENNVRSETLCLLLSVKSQNQTVTLEFKTALKTEILIHPIVIVEAKVIQM